ncbi:uncharacterized protein LOC100367963 isoform X2 [Saccoglossus kowalevskii]|uniref:Uncharacterized protein LOC100367963 isoform 2 n=1 Tax=Saccoglossus kowalevskii TaxID=10224 RepID=A0ABM0GKF2_SACKO|nr:PREDICTED: uncharacterized protein LOC100367963 isoform 2 [Saccoglossus kowalevskii]
MSHTVTRQGSLPDLRETSDFVVDHDTKEMLELRDEMLNLHVKPAYNSPRSAWSAGSSRQELDRLRLQTPQTPQIKPQEPVINGDIKNTPHPPPQNGLRITGKNLPILPSKQPLNGPMHTRVFAVPPKPPSTMKEGARRVTQV